MMNVISENINLIIITILIYTRSYTYIFKKMIII